MFLSKFRESGSVVTRTAVAPFDVGFVANINLGLSASLVVANICPAALFTCGTPQPDSLSALRSASIVAPVAHVKETCALTRLGGCVSGVDHNLKAIARQARDAGGSPADTIIGARTSGGGGRGGLDGKVGGA